MRDTNAGGSGSGSGKNRKPEFYVPLHTNKPLPDIPSEPDSIGPPPVSGGGGGGNLSSHSSPSSGVAAIAYSKDYTDVGSAGAPSQSPGSDSKISHMTKRGLLKQLFHRDSGNTKGSSLSSKGFSENDGGSESLGRASSITASLASHLKARAGGGDKTSSANHGPSLPKSIISRRSVDDTSVRPSSASNSPRHNAHNYDATLSTTSGSPGVGVASIKDGNIFRKPTSPSKNYHRYSLNLSGSGSGSSYKPSHTGIKHLLKGDLEQQADAKEISGSDTVPFQHQESPLPLPPPPPEVPQKVSMTSLTPPHTAKVEVTNDGVDMFLKKPKKKQSKSKKSDSKSTTSPSPAPGEKGSVKSGKSSSGLSSSKKAQMRKKMLELKKEDSESRKRISESSEKSLNIAHDKFPKYPVIPPIKILVVEDNEVSRMMVYQFIYTLGLTCQVAKNGQEALNMWRDAAEGKDKTGPYHLIFMDIQMPVMDGLETTSKIRELEQKNKVGAWMARRITLFSTPPIDKEEQFRDQYSLPFFGGLNSGGGVDGREAGGNSGINGGGGGLFKRNKRQSQIPSRRFRNHPGILPSLGNDISFIEQIEDELINGKPSPYYEGLAPKVRWRPYYAFNSSNNNIQKPSEPNNPANTTTTTTTTTTIAAASPVPRQLPSMMVDPNDVSPVCDIATIPFTFQSLSSANQQQHQPSSPRVTLNSWMDQHYGENAVQHNHFRSFHVHTITADFVLEPTAMNNRSSAILKARGKQHQHQQQQPNLALARRSFLMPEPKPIDQLASVAGNTTISNNSNPQQTLGGSTLAGSAELPNPTAIGSGFDDGKKLGENKNVIINTKDTAGGADASTATTEDNVKPESSPAQEGDTATTPGGSTARFLPNAPVIILALTASNRDEDRKKALQVGCNDYLTKPVNTVWLGDKIIEWGCMQALIDHEWWPQWRSLKKKMDNQQAPLTPPPTSSTPYPPANMASKVGGEHRRHSRR
ncbi:response regulator [Mycoemilia scoparia]|uniref:Response regulator n=1 Tax=Mycoemilia scoparia TaxID=417184 RepID=A0A9W8DMX2_9FUNG|nr:response regulator [Mycoemilia scoparia]